jgi:hypothetical protein
MSRWRHGLVGYVRQFQVTYYDDAEWHIVGMLVSIEYSLTTI